MKSIHSRIVAGLLLTALTVSGVFSRRYERGFCKICVENESGVTASASTDELFPAYYGTDGTLAASLDSEHPLPEASDREIADAAARLAPTVRGRYLLWTDLCRLRTYVLRRETGGSWEVIKRLPCSAGDASHPTPSGLFEIGVHRESFGRPDRYIALYAMQIVGDYLYHSVLLSPDGSGTVDGRLGERVSHGCIRHSVEDSRWLYETIPDGTAVLIR